MEDSAVIKPAHIVLEAVRLTSDADITSLRRLTAANSQVLKLELILRILLSFLPESVETDLYINLLHDVSAVPPAQTSEHYTFPEQNVSDEEAAIQVRKLQLRPLIESHYSYLDCNDLLTLFIIHRAHQIDTETGSLPLILQLIEPFINRSECLQSWAISVFLPLLRFDYEYYPDNGPTYSLEAFEALDGNLTIDSLLSESVQLKKKTSKSNIGRDLRGLIGPWLYGERMRGYRKLQAGQFRTRTIQPPDAVAICEDYESNRASSGWTHVNEWLLELALKDFSQVAEAVAEWDGPQDVDYGNWDPGNRPGQKDFLHDLTMRYTQAALATVYATNDCSAGTLESSFIILRKVAKLMHLRIPRELSFEIVTENWDFMPEFLNSLLQSHLLHNSLLRPNNPFTTPTEDSLHLCYLILSSNFILQQLSVQIPSRKLIELSFFGSLKDQLAELRKILYGLQVKVKSQDDWSQVRKSLLKLQNWDNESKDRLRETQKHAHGVFCRVDLDSFEGEILKMLLNLSYFDLAKNIYCMESPGPIPLVKVEETVLNAALASYDGASNGNRTRGGVRKASEIILSFRSQFPESVEFEKALALISATHAMSFYSLTLQHGVPFQPANIRAHKDSISLIEKILNQNAHSYTKLDDLLEIGSNLVTAGITQPPNDRKTDYLYQTNLSQELLTVNRRIAAMAIKSALAEEDFDTAYSYVVNRLSPPNKPLSKNDIQIEYLTTDNISWQAAYQAGQYSIKPNSTSVLRRLEQRMELLSQALLLAPSSALSEILISWRRCEEKMAAQMEQEIKEEEIWDDKGDRRIPGDYSFRSSPSPQKPRDPSRNAINEEAPMGLFDVARGAAAALSKNAFPLRGSSQNSESASPIPKSQDRVNSNTGSESGNFGGADTEGRVRKRDMVSNMVTGGLASGIGWVIGAPVPRRE